MTHAIAEGKKAALLELFKDAVIGEMAAGPDYVEEAVNKAKSVGITDSDMEWLDEVLQDSDRFFKVFGENALSKEFQALLKMSDDLQSGMGEAFGWGVPPRYKGLYPAFDK